MPFETLMEDQLFLHGIKLMLVRCSSPEKSNPEYLEIEMFFFLSFFIWIVFRNYLFDREFVHFFRIAHIRV